MKTPRQNIRFDNLDPARAAAMHATLGRDGPAPDAGDPLPPFWHYLYFWETIPPNHLGRDGHPKPGGFLPDTGLPRRMWAGGKLEFLAPVLLGQKAEKRSIVSSVTQKTGRTGPLALLAVDHEIHQNGQICIRECQDLIYRPDPDQDPDPDPKAAKPSLITARKDEDTAQSVSFTPTFLFRYSALTFNGHRIHYDRDYCRDIEGYPGLVVHGPLLAQMLLHRAADLLGDITRFTFRATAPLFDFETAEICTRSKASGLMLWVRGPDGRQCMEAQAD